MAQSILDHPNIVVHLDAGFTPEMVADFDHVFYSGTVTFVGRLGTYRYMDMDVTIRAALDTVRAWHG